MINNFGKPYTLSKFYYCALQPATSLNTMNPKFYVLKKAIINQTYILVTKAQVVHSLSVCTVNAVEVIDFPLLSLPSSRRRQKKTMKSSIAVR